MNLPTRSTARALACAAFLACSPSETPPVAPAAPSAPVAKPEPAKAEPANPEPAPAKPEAAKPAAPVDLDSQVPDIEYVPTPQNVVDKLLDAAKIQKGDVLYD